MTAAAVSRLLSGATPDHLVNPEIMSRTEAAS
jgi:hypothetical protein